MNQQEEEEGEKVNKGQGLERIEEKWKIKKMMVVMMMHNCREQ